MLKRILFGLLPLALAAGSFACDGGPAAADGPAANVTNSNAAATNANRAATNADAAAPAPVQGYEVVNTFPHDANAFTQGLVFQDGALLESTGQYGQSSLRRVELKTGKVLKRVAVAPQFFAEGLALMGGKLYQLTWQHKRGFVYDAQTFEKTGEFVYNSEGWGLTHDADSLILSDGSDRLRFIDPADFRVKREISVRDGGHPVYELNELEYVKGEIYANVWHQNRVARIDPQTGRVLAWVDFTGLLKAGDVSNDEAVLNGIAYDEAGGRLFVTGKLWPKLFEVRLKDR